MNAQCRRSAYLQRLFVATTVLSLLAATAGAGWLSGYSYRKAVTIDADAVSGAADLADFPVLISLTDAVLKSTAAGGKVTHTNGYDIAFTGSDGAAALDHEVESYTPTSGELIAWLRVPLLDHDDDTTLYLYYGNGSISSSQETAHGVWTNGCRMVLHMNQTPPGQVLDSTAYANHGTTYGGMGAGNATNGAIGAGLYFDGADDAVNKTIENTAADCVLVADDASIDFGDEDFTVCWWANSAGFESYTRSWQKGRTWQDGLANAANYTVSRRELWGTNFVYWSVDDTADDTAATYAGVLSSDGQWHHWTLTRDSSNDLLTTYIDAAEAAVATNTAGDISSSGWGLVIGSGYWSNSLLWRWGMEFTCDELRIISGVCSPDWIATSHTNQAAPANFYAIGAEESGSGTLFQF